jgi:phosphoglycolate phosphatase
MGNQEKSIIVWDWNGTLLNDVDICIETMNGMLDKRKLPLLDAERYKSVFTFPVKDYYAALGFNFDKEPFDTVAMEFIDGYRDKVRSARVFKEASFILESFRSAGYRQFLISAMEHEFLKETLVYNKLLRYFEVYSGVQDHYAHGKVEMAKQVFMENNINGSEIYFIGDTIHDFEVAKSLNLKPVLIANGHQSADRLITTGADVLTGLTDVLEYFKISKEFDQ